jgi:flagellar hook-associated protein 2
VGISTSGVGSGLDINGLVTQLMSIESRPLVKLDQKESRIQAKISAYGSLKGVVSAFETAMKGLSAPSKYQSVSTTVSDASILSAVATAGTAPANYSVEVKQLATSQKLVSGTFTNASEVVGAGTVTIRFGTDGEDGFTLNPDMPSRSITINNSNNTLTGIRDAINSAGAGVTATLMNDGNGFRLIIASAQTGADYAMKLEVIDSGDSNNLDNAGLSQLSYDPDATVGAGKNMAETILAQDALLKIDGVDNIRNSNNVISDVIDGVTLSLHKASDPGDTVSLAVAKDKTAVRSAVSDFATAYNNLIKTVKDLTAYNATTKTASILQGDASTLNLMSRLRSILNSQMSTGNGSYSTLSELGLSIQRDATMKINDSQLQAAINSHFEDIAVLFGSSGKTSDSYVSYISSTDKTVQGKYVVNITGVPTKGATTGAASALLSDTTVTGTFDTPFIIDASNDTLAVKIDGIQSGTVVMGHGSYTTTAALAAELQSRINGDSLLTGNNKTVSVTFDSLSDRFRIESDNYGSISNVEVTAISSNTQASLGLTVVQGNPGTDVAGTIGGYQATGKANILKGITGASIDGLVIQVNGGITGDRGYIEVSHGFAARLAKLATELLNDDGPIKSRTEGLSSSVDDINTQRDAIELHLTGIEQRLRAQYTALDGLLGRMRSTSDFLTQQLANIQNISAGNK